jgi:hypothetical protein
VIFRIKDPLLVNQIFTQVITPYLADNLKTRILQPDGNYLRLHEARKLAHLRNGHRFNVQEFLIDLTEGRQTLEAVPQVQSFVKYHPAHPESSS